MASSVSDFRSKLKKPAAISVTIPGTDLIVECRHPNLFTMAMKGLITWPALARVQAINTVEAEGVIDNRPLPALADKATAFGDLLDEWVCAAAVAPLIRMSAADLEVQQGLALSIDEIPFDVRVAIWNATALRPDPAVAEFRGDQPASAPPGSSSEAVRDTPVDAAEGHG